MELSSFSEATVAQRLKNFPKILRKPEGSLSCSQESATGPYPEPDESSAYYLIFL
jgi:hypothetical protein